MTVYETWGGSTVAASGAEIPVFVQGSPFDLQLLVDPVSESASARFSNGATTVSTTPISLAFYDEARPDAVIQLLGLNNNFGSGGGAVADFTELRVETVPGPSLGQLAMLAFGGLALRRRR